MASTTFVTGTTISSSWLNDVNTDVYGVKSYGAAGDGITDDTAAFISFFADGGGEIPSGTYLIDSISIANLINVVCRPNVIIKKRTGVSGQSRLIEFLSGSEGSSWEGGTIDCPSSLLVNWVYQGIFNDWQAIHIGCERVRIHNVVFTGWPNHPLHGAGDFLEAKNLTFYRCATGPLFGWSFNTDTLEQDRPTGASGLGQTVSGIYLRECGDIGIAGTLQHLFDTYGCAGGTYDNVNMYAPGGKATGLSYAVSGWTDKLSRSCTFSNFVYESPTTEELQHLAFSLLGTNKSTIVNLLANNYSGLGLELLDVTDTTISNVFLDTGYRITSSTSLTASKGVSVDEGKYNSLTSARGTIGTKDVILTNLICQRVGIGFDMKSGKVILSNSKFTGCVNNSVVVNQRPAASTFAGATTDPGCSLDLLNVTSEYCGGPGVNVADVGTLKIIGCTLNNNGQDSSFASTTRSGAVISVADHLTIKNSDLSDSQSWTIASGISFKPGVSTNDRYDVFASLPANYSYGQRVTISNAGGPGVNHTGWVYDMDGEKLTLQFSGATTFSSTGNITALSGTWSSSGTTLTGIGTAALTEVTGPIWVTDGSNWRRIIAVSTNTAAVLNEAFPSPLSGATLSKLTCSVSGVPSQQYGTRIFGAVASHLLQGNTYTGNALEKTLISTPSQGLTGTEYFRVSSTTTNASPLNLQTGIPAGHRLIGVSTNNDVTISGGGATSFELRLVNAGSSTLESITSGVALAQNTKIKASCLGAAMIADGNILRTVFAGGTPTTGTIKCEALYRIDSPPALANT